MIKDNQKRLNRLHILLDILVTSAAYALAWFIVVSGKVLPVDVGVLKPQIYCRFIWFCMPVSICMYPNGYKDGVQNLPISVKPTSLA